jgi:hypothetical protein
MEFVCDNCNRSWPRSQLKEAFVDNDGRREKMNLCPECLDEQMNAAQAVYGVEGDEKARAAFIAEDEDAAPEDEEVTGKRESI